MPAPPQQRTPLRRVSQGSLRALSRSQTFQDAPHGLGFLEPAMEELADEAETLHNNVANLNALSQSLGAFNEAFASYLFVMEMNGLTTDWPQAPTSTSFELARKRAEDDARAAQEALRAATEAAERSAREREESQTLADATTDASYVNATSTTTISTGAGGTKAGGGILKAAQSGAVKKVKPKLTAKERKERSMAIDKAVMNLPLEFRGQDPNLRRNVEAVIEALMDKPTGLELLQMVKPPELSQARVNKCLIALVNRKIVRKDTSSGRVMYVWCGVPS